MDISELKYERLSEPERFLLDIFDGLEKYIDDSYPESVFYKKDNMAFFEYNSNGQTLWYSYDYISVFFSDKFDLDYQESNDMIQSMVEEHLKLIVMSTHQSPFIYIMNEWNNILN